MKHEDANEIILNVNYKIARTVWAEVMKVIKMSVCVVVMR